MRVGVRTNRNEKRRVIISGEARGAGIRVAFDVFAVVFPKVKKLEMFSFITITHTNVDRHTWSDFQQRLNTVFSKWCISPVTERRAPYVWISNENLVILSLRFIVLEASSGGGGIFLISVEGGAHFAGISLMYSRMVLGSSNNFAIIFQHSSFVGGRETAGPWFCIELFARGAR